MKVGATAIRGLPLLFNHLKNRIAMEELQKVMGTMLPMFENWLRMTVRDEMLKSLEADRNKAKPEKTYSREEVCALAHISKVTLWTKQKNGEINPTRIGRRVVYSETEVKRLLGNA